MIHFEVRGAVLVLRMEHGKVQALDIELLEQLDDAFERAGHGIERAIVLTGTGSAFCAGVDLKRVVDEGPDHLRRFLPALTRVFLKLIELPKPVVAAVNGHAIAGGCLLALACDRRVMAHGNGRMGVPELKVGVTFPAIVLEILRSVVPAHYLREVAYSGVNFMCDEAMARGMIDELSPPEKLLDRAVQAAAGWGELRPSSFALTKRQMNGPIVDQFERWHREIDGRAMDIWRAPETAESIRAFLDRTVGKKT